MAARKQDDHKYSYVGLYKKAVPWQRNRAMLM